MVSTDRRYVVIPIELVSHMPVDWQDHVASLLRMLESAYRTAPWPEYMVMPTASRRVASLTEAEHDAAGVVGEIDEETAEYVLVDRQTDRRIEDPDKEIRHIPIADPLAEPGRRLRAL